MTAPATAATITVTTNADEFSLNGECSLREAIRNANLDSAPNTDCPPGSGTDTVVIPSGFFIKLTLTGQGDNVGLTGDLDINSPLTIAGAGPLTTAVNGNLTDRVFEVRPGAGPVGIAGLRIENGRLMDAGGGGILNQGTLVVADSLVSNNASDGVFTAIRGGGIQNLGGTLTVSDSFVSGNSATGLGSGGGIAQTTGSNTLTVVNSTVSGNTASNAGGGVYDQEGVSIVVRDSVITGNTAGSQGGGLFLFGLATTAYNLSNVTIADNRGTAGGGLYLHAEGAAGVARLRVLRNQATSSRGGGVWIDQEGPGLVDLRETSISRNSASLGGGGLATQGGGAGDILVRGTTLNGNNAVDGDGVSSMYTGGDLLIVNSTISGNGLSSASGNGGGVHNGTAMATMLLANVTLSGNSAGASGGNIYNAGVMTAKNTIAAEAGTGGNCGGTDPANQNNLEPPDVASPCGWTGGSPRLGLLRNNGGPTQTHALAANSSARNTGAGCEGTDQRGVPRSLGGACDVGAYERVRCLGGVVNRVGTSGNDRMVDGAGNQVYLTLGGRDYVRPGSGADRVCLGSGNDTADLRDGSGTDRASGGRGTDRVIRDPGDRVSGFERFG